MIQNKIAKVLDKVRELPTLPVIANKVSALLNDPKTDTVDLAKLVEKDQSITTKILNLVNSAYYSLPQEVTNIAQGISLLGYKNMSYIIMALSVFDTFKKTEKHSFDRKGFWLHSIATAILSVKIAKECMYSTADDTFTSGLLHDIGKVFMDGFLHEEFQMVIEAASKNNVSFYDAELSLFDFNHVMVGEWIARAWKLPLHVVASIKHHHQEPEDREGLAISNDTAIDFVRLADVAVRFQGYGKNGDGTKYKPDLDQSLFKRLPIFEEDFKNLISGLGDDIRKSKVLLGIAAD